jgi:hypothetical protein
VLVNKGVHQVYLVNDHHGFTNAFYTLYELLYLLTPDSDHHGFTNVLYGLDEIQYLLTPESEITGVHKRHRER